MIIVMSYYTNWQHCSTTLHGKQARAGWPDCAQCILSNIYEILPNSLPN